MLININEIILHLYYALMHSFEQRKSFEIIILTKNRLGENNTRENNAAE